MDYVDLRLTGNEAQLLLDYLEDGSYRDEDTMDRISGALAAAIAMAS